MKRIVFFNPIELLPFVVFLIGLFFKIIHSPIGDIVLLSSAPFALVIYTLQHILHRDKSAVWVKLLISLCKALWIFYFTAKIFFWANAPIIFYITIVVSVFAIILSIYKKQLIILQGLLLVFFIALGFFLLLWPNHKLYYILNMSSDAKEHPEDYPPQAWDRYSWFLYTDKHFDEALDANHLAYKAAANTYNKLVPLHDSIFEQLENHKQKIESQEWNKYDPIR